MIEEFFSVLTYPQKIFCTVMYKVIYVHAECFKTLRGKLKIVLD